MSMTLLFIAAVALGVGVAGIGAWRRGDRAEVRGRAMVFLAMSAAWVATFAVLGKPLP